MSNRFDPVEGRAYGRCLNCHIEFDSKELADEHMHETLQPIVGGTTRSKSHSIRVTNPTRESRIKSQIQDQFIDAMDEMVLELDGMIDDGDLTEAEVTEALRGLESANDFWKTHLLESKEWDGDAS